MHTTVYYFFKVCETVCNNKHFTTLLPHDIMDKDLNKCKLHSIQCILHIVFLKYVKDYATINISKVLHFTVVS